MEKNELQEIKEKLEAKGISWEQAAENIKFDVRLLNLYLVSPPVPTFSVINPLKKMLE
jgi:ribosome-binding protein aMBF1 (putative translation factor)